MFEKTRKRPTILFRNDDVTLNTDPFHLDRIYNVIRNEFPDAELWACVTMFSKKNNEGSVYPGAPFKDKPIRWFYNVDQLTEAYKVPNDVKVVSHGCWHIDHRDVSYDMQEASILTSCNYLNTDIFVPPFNFWNETTEKICEENGIDLVKFEEGWRSLEHEVFNVNTTKLWYFHSWNWNPKDLQAKLRECKEVTSD